MDFISIIIPAFNSERWLDRTLQSVTNAIDKDCEVIIVNDGSVDRTAEIAEKYVNDDPRFSMVNISHVGPCAARKAGVAECQGDYIMFVDSDDILPETSIADHRQLLDSWMHPDSASQGMPSGVRPKIVVANTLVRGGHEDHLLLLGSRQAMTGLEYAGCILRREIFGFLPGHLYARDIVDSIDWDDSPIITHQENYYLLLSFAMKLNQMAPDERLVLIAPDVVGYKYMRRPGSQSALMSLTPMGLERVWNHIRSLGVPDRELTIWGLDMIGQAFVNRGIPFPSKYSVAVELSQRARLLGDELPEHLHEMVTALASANKRRRIAKHLARTAGWTSLSAHLSLILVCHGNVRLVERTVASIFDMGFRNLEVVIVDLDNTHSYRVALNKLSIHYPRVRIIHAPENCDGFTASWLGLNASTGLSVTFLRPGDLVNAEGLYDAVTRIDYGADIVLANYRHYNRMTRMRGKKRTYAHFRSNAGAQTEVRTGADITENVYDAVLNHIAHPKPEDPPLYIYGMVWRAEFLKDNPVLQEDFSDVPREYLNYAFMGKLLKNPVRVVTQDSSTPASFEFRQ